MLLDPPPDDIMLLLDGPAPEDCIMLLDSPPVDIMLLDSPLFGAGMLWLDPL
jgi:hypothetical protein